MKECDCCGYKTKLSKYERDRTKEDPKPDPMFICALCAGTYAGDTLQYPKESADVLKTICYVGNAILHEIRSNKKL